ncbi:MAG: ATP-dependent DNA helicase [Chloroflexota bacterium]|nr:ATP-dependent DNA helicase [Chloroflexota bacterium]
MHAPAPPTRDPRQVLEATFGYSSFRPGQREIIDAVLAGRDCIGVMPTGAGKSLTFQIPAKLLGGTVLVISPLISLMRDQVDALERFGFRAAVLNSTLGSAERAQRLREARHGQLELLYVAPEALSDSLRAYLSTCPIKLIVVDEAHCISHWGHDFRPAYRQLSNLKSQFGDVPVLALTATATRRVAIDIVRQLGMRKPAGYKGSFYRPNLRITAHKKGTGRNTRNDILALIRAHRDQSGIVYSATRRGVDQLTDWLTGQRVRAVAYHAGLDDAARARNQDMFARDEAQVVVATVAFGMGIDKSNVRFVVHREMPRSIEAWYQEIGRAGRDGLPSHVVTFYSWKDVVDYDVFLDDVRDPELRAQTRARTVALFRLLDRGGCRHQALVGYFDEPIAPCGEACDRCLGMGLEALLRPASVRAAAVPMPGAPSALGPVETHDGEHVFDRLRALRRQIADAEGVPAYIVFSDAVLRELAHRQPRSEREMLAIPGVGPSKLQRYGARFLQLLRAD